MRKEEISQPKGSTRFEDRRDGELYRISKKLGEGTFELETMDGKPVMQVGGQSKKKVSAEHLIKCDMPELDLNLNEHTPRRVEIMDNADHNVWNLATVERFTADGRAVLRYDKAPNVTRMTDLLQERYRWVQEGAPAAAAAAA